MHNNMQRSRMYIIDIQRSVFASDRRHCAQKRCHRRKRQVRRRPLRKRWMRACKHGRAGQTCTCRLPRGDEGFEFTEHWRHPAARRALGGDFEQLQGHDSSREKSATGRSGKAETECSTGADKDSAAAASASNRDSTRMHVCREINCR